MKWRYSRRRAQPIRARLSSSGPVKGPHLAGVKPDYTLRGKAVRYDCIVMARES